MGVNHLWSVLAPVKKHKCLESLQGQILAVDLSLWICESQAVKQMQGNVIKPFLRNLFFRVNHLLQLGIGLVFVIDGCPPKMKMDTIRKRLNHAHRTNDNIGDWKKQPNRNRFNIFLRECCCLLESLGIPYIESCGEAEAYAAFLNAQGIVDACLTNDGDAFLYGAKKIYRNFTMDSKDPHVESYNIKDIENQIKLNRRHLVAFALLVGCDYLPKGVPKIGVETTLKLFKILGEKDALSRFQEWRSMKSFEFLTPVEANVRNKALSLPEFPYEEIIKEFLVPKDKLPTKDLHWKQPNIKKFQEITAEKLEWTQEYALKKIIPLVTKWTMLEIVGVIPSRHHDEHIIPEKILRTRIKQGIPCFEVKWKPSDTTDENDENYMSIEEQEIFRKCYPYIVEKFSQCQISKYQAENKEPRKKNILVQKKNMQPIDNLLLDLEKLSLIPSKLNETKSCRMESVHAEPHCHRNHIEIHKKGTKFTLSCQPVSSSISQQAQNLINLKNDRMLPVELKPDFLNCSFTSPRSDDKYFTSQKKQQKEFCYSINNERYVQISPLHDISTHLCHKTIDENDENLFSPVFNKLHYQYLLAENKSESVISRGKHFSHSSDVNLKSKEISNFFRVSNQSTPKAHHKTHDPEFVFFHNTNVSDKLNENFSADSFILQETKIDYKMDRMFFLNDISLKNDSVNLNEISFENDLNSISNDIVPSNHSSLLNKNDFIQDKIAYIPVKDNFKNIHDNLMLDKNVKSTKSFTDVSISDCSNESFSEEKTLSTSSNSKLVSKKLDDQDLLPYSSFENDSLTINVVESALNSTLYSFEKNDLGQFEILTTFLDDTYKNNSLSVSQNENKINIT